MRAKAKIGDSNVKCQYNRTVSGAKGCWNTAAGRAVMQCSDAVKLKVRELPRPPATFHPQHSQDVTRAGLMGERYSLSFIAHTDYSISQNIPTA